MSAKSPRKLIGVNSIGTLLKTLFLQIQQLHLSLKLPLLLPDLFYLQAFLLVLQGDPRQHRLWTERRYPRSTCESTTLYPQYRLREPQHFYMRAAPGSDTIESTLSLETLKEGPQFTWFVHTLIRSGLHASCRKMKYIYKGGQHTEAEMWDFDICGFWPPTPVMVVILLESVVNRRCRLLLISFEED